MFCFLNVSLYKQYETSCAMRYCGRFKSRLLELGVGRQVLKGKNAEA